MCTGLAIKVVAIELAVFARTLKAARLKTLPVIVLSLVSFVKDHTGLALFVYTLLSVIFTDTHLTADIFNDTLLLVLAGTNLPCDSTEGHYFIDNCQYTTGVWTAAPGSRVAGREAGCAPARHSRGIGTRATCYT